MLREAITGMAEACEALGTPVVSGNVSLYNEHGGRPIHPTPVVGTVGLLPAAAEAVPAWPAGGGPLEVLLLGGAVPAHDGSERQRLEDGAASGRIPEVDLDAVGSLCAALVAAREARLLRSAHDASDGGLAVAAAEVCLGAGIGADLELPNLAGRGDLTLFGEACGLVLTTCSAADRAALEALAARHGVGATAVGRLGGDRIRLRAGTCALDLLLADARTAHEGTLPAAMEATA
jgi:phosphoribosylformylglycinamidine synthase